MLWDCDGSASQVWEPYPGGLKNAASGRCLDQTTLTPTDGTRPAIFDCTGAPVQRWETAATTTAKVSYQHATGRVTSLTDRNGASWTLAAPTLIADPPQREVEIASSAPTTVTYSYDTDNGGRLVKRTDSFASRTWAYGDNGFTSSQTDENGNTTHYVTDDRGNVTRQQTCRVPGSPASDCHIEYFGYYHNAADPLDPRNDVQVWSADARSADENDLTYRTTKEIDAAGRVTKVTYPKPAGQSVNPTEEYAYTVAGGGGGSGPPASYAQSTETRSFILADTVMSLSGDDQFEGVDLPSQ